ncbi:Pentulose kinase [Wallemia mellicola]|uniref:Pentulose kinase n=2 Tax=Wallemia mellicola TaxID=1708541 RepID=A0A4T0NLW9_9BASI|nr:Pentulose kinase [Wallemia mellicola]
MIYKFVPQLNLGTFTFTPSYPQLFSFSNHHELTKEMTAEYFIGIDVGTGSARSALVNITGDILAESTYNTKTWRDANDANIFEQSSANIWQCISQSVKDVVRQAQIPKEAVKGIAFDATCSLAVTDYEGNPIAVTKGDSLGKEGERNIILWADHRAEKEATFINSTGAMPLQFVGGTVSLEMEIPKTLWLKNNMKPEDFKKCMFFDLPDWLSYRATRSTARSNNSLGSKFTYVTPSIKGAYPSGWDPKFLEQVGLGDLVQQDFVPLGGSPDKNGLVLTGGLPIGNGLTKEAAEELGLAEGTAVGSSVIDAYAGWIGTVAARSAKKGEELPKEAVAFEECATRLAACAGTSTCHIVQSPEGVFVKGVWGPYKNAVFPGWWMNEGGQSSTGQLIDFVLKTHIAYPELERVANERQTNIFEILEELLQKAKEEEGVDSINQINKHMHFYPDLHGNRSPLADSRMRGMITGLGLDGTLGDLARKFQLTLEAIALQTRHIIEEMNEAGHKVNSIYMSGGQVKNRALMQLMADVCQMPLILPASASGPVVAGCAMLGRYAYELSQKKDYTEIVKQQQAEQVGEGNKRRLWQLMTEMTKPGERIEPNCSKKDSTLLNAKYKIFRESIDIQRKWRKEVEDALEGAQ